MSKSNRAPADPLRRWTVKDALDLYCVDQWGRDYFGVNKQGHLTVSHDRATIDLKLLVDDLVIRGIQPPLLLRLTNLLESRLELLNGAFADAIAKYGYRGAYRGVYPIKVNQSRKVVEAVTRFGRRYHHGLEAGSKAELLAVMAMLDDEEALVVCNGYKDEHYIETALLAAKLGRTVVLVVEKPGELERIHAVATELGVRPTIGIRVRPTSRGAGKWEHSGGDRAKFGLSATEIISAVNKLQQWDRVDCLRLLHFHLGSQISSIRSIKDALREASRMFTELRKLGCAQLDMFDVGGGLGVDYDGSQTNSDSSMNYTVQEYANDVVSAVMEACDSEDIAHPTIVSESGRALVAHHALLVVNVVDVNEQVSSVHPPEPDDDDSDVAFNLWETLTTVNAKNLRECFHDALEYKDQLVQLFNLGHLSLAERARCEQLFWAACRRMVEIAASLPRMPRELLALERMLGDTYFCNFSMFQSLPDAWAVDQLFPIVPIHRLDERPTRRALLADITCDSDGTIDSFIAVRDVKATLDVHAPDGAPYYLGFLLTGAYQEILGDLHNLFGDTPVVHVAFDPKGGYEVDEVTQGDSITDVLQYVDYSPTVLVNRLRGHIERAVRRGLMSLEESKQLMQCYQSGLSSSTYLE